MSPTSCSEVAERSPISRRPIADQSPTSFNDSHAPILLKLVGDRSATDRGLVGDFAGTCLRPNQSQPGFCASTKTWLRLIWSQRGPRSVADFSRPRRDRSGTLLRPLRSVKIVSRGEVAERLQCMSDWGLTQKNNNTYMPMSGSTAMAACPFACRLNQELKMHIIVSI